MDNGQSKDKLVVPPALPNASKEETPALMCHKFFVPFVLQQQDNRISQKINVIPNIGNFPCIKEKCMLWNAEKSECYDVTQAKALSDIAVIRKAVDAAGQ